MLPSGLMQAVMCIQARRAEGPPSKRARGEAGAAATPESLWDAHMDADANEIQRLGEEKVRSV